MQPKVDQEGFLVSLHDWDETAAHYLAHAENIALTHEHWEVIKVLRQFYQETGVSPAMRILVKLIKTRLGEDKGTSLYLLTLFPGSPAKLAAKIAGLPKPTNCL